MSSNLALVIGGSGSVGSLFCELLLKRYQKVVVVDLVENRQLKKMGVDFTRGDIGHLSEIDLINDAELVLVTTPEEPAIHAIDSLVSLLHPGQCLIDTLSVKSPISKSLRRLGSGVEAISINPMFGPSLGFNGQSVAAVDYCSGPISNSFLPCL